MTTLKLVRYLQSAANILFKPLRVDSSPIHLILEPTTYCPLNCIMCKRSKYIQQPAHLKLTEFKQIFDQIRPLRLTLSGLGESLVHPDLIEMIRYAHQDSCQVSTTTSLAVSNISLSDLVTSGLSRLKISLDAVDKEVYQRIRGQDLFEGIIDRIKELVRIKQQLNSKWPHLCLQFVIQSENVHQLSDILQLGANLGIDAVSFRMLGLAGIDERREKLTDGLQVLKEELIKAKQISKGLKLKTNLLDLIRDNAQTKPADCSFPWFSTYITVDGYVKPCCLFSYLDGGFGNILQDRFELIWNNRLYRQFRQSIKKGQSPHQRCQGCNPERIIDLAAAMRRIVS